MISYGRRICILASLLVMIILFAGSLKVGYTGYDNALFSPFEESLEINMSRGVRYSTAAATVSKVDNPDKGKWKSVVNASPFQDLVRCKTPVITDPEKLKQYREQFPPEKPKCSPSVFRKYFEGNHRFYQHGMWYVTNDTNPAGATFFPRDCYFDESVLESGTFSKCLAKKKTKKVLFVGDSNGHFYFISLLRFFEQHSANCTQVRIEKEDDPPNVDTYYSIPGHYLLRKSKGCTHCFGRTFFCEGFYGPAADQSNGITLEYFGIIRTIDQRLRYPHVPADNYTNRFPKRDNFLEYMLLDYLPHYGIPDLWIMSAPFHHESLEMNYDEHSVSMDLFSKLLSNHLPNRTTLLMLSDSRECPVNQPRWVIEKFMDVSNNSKNEVLHNMNQLLFNALEDQLISEESKILGFLDMGVLSCPFTCRWHMDGAHMLQEWYTQQIRFMFAYMCAGNV